MVCANREANFIPSRWKWPQSRLSQSEALEWSLGSLDTQMRKVRGKSRVKTSLNYKMFMVHKYLTLSGLSYWQWPPWKACYSLKHYDKNPRIPCLVGDSNNN